MKDKTAVFVLPHKGFDKISKEYNVKFSEAFLHNLGEYIVKDQRKAFEITAEIGQKHGLKGKELGSFIYDVIRTAVFYKKAIEVIAQMMGSDKNGEN